jgi:pyruvate dehydrogenase E1 component alpha subunit
MKKSEVEPGVAAASPGEGEFSLIPHHKLLDLYAAMLKCRAIAARLPIAIRRRRTGSSLICEAVSAGIIINLTASDAISPAPSDLTPCALKGVSPKTLLRWWPNQSGRIPARFAQAHVIPPSASTAARLEAAVRLASHIRSANDGSVVVFFAAPDAPTGRRSSANPAAPALSRQLLQSFLRHAAQQRLPILFVWQCNRDSEDLPAIAQQCGVPGMAVDSNDVVAVYRVASEALAHARRGSGPSLIDSRSWRPDGSSPKKDRRPPKKPESLDPIGKMELYLAGKGLAYTPAKRKVLKEIATQLGPK